MTEDELWDEIQDCADNFTIAHNSDCFYLLACILAYYKVRGTSPEEMIGPRMQETIEWLIAKKAND